MSMEFRPLPAWNTQWHYNQRNWRKKSFHEKWLWYLYKIGMILIQDIKITLNLCVNCNGHFCWNCMWSSSPLTHFRLSRMIFLDSRYIGFPFSFCHIFTSLLKTTACFLPQQEEACYILDHDHPLWYVPMVLVKTASCSCCRT